MFPITSPGCKQSSEFYWRRHQMATKRNIDLMIAHTLRVWCNDWWIKRKIKAVVDDFHIYYSAYLVDGTAKQERILNNVLYGAKSGMNDKTETL